MDRDRWIQLRKTLQELEFISGLEGEEDSRSKRNLAQAFLEDKLIPETEVAAPLIILISGGTNTGKSSLLNWIISREVSAVSALARGTKSPVMCGSNVSLETIEQAWRKYRFQTMTHPEDSLAETDQQIVLLSQTHPFPPEGCIIVDSPDFDSNFIRNRIWAEQLLRFCDAVILTVTPEKYHDEAVMEHLRSAHKLGKSVIGVFNKCEDETALDDFKILVRSCTGENTPVLSIHRMKMDRASVPEAADQLKKYFTEMLQTRSNIKINSIRGSRLELERCLNFLSSRIREESQYISDIHRSLNDLKENAVLWYRTELKKDKFVEIDIVFQRLLQQYRIRIIEDVYDAMKKGTKVAWRTFTRLIPGIKAKSESPEVQRLAREQERANIAVNMVSAEIHNLEKKVPQPMVHLVKKWVSSWYMAYLRPDPEPFLAQSKKHVDVWIETETANIAEKVKAYPNTRRFLMIIKASVQIGFGVIGAYVMGGFNPSDLIVGPALERLMSVLVEAGYGRTYFLRKRTALLDMRCQMLRDFLETSVIQSLRDQIPRREHEEVLKRIQEFSGMAGKKEKKA